MNTEKHTCICTLLPAVMLEMAQQASFWRLSCWLPRRCWRAGSTELLITTCTRECVNVRAVCACPCVCVHVFVCPLPTLQNDTLLSIILSVPGGHATITEKALAIHILVA